MLALNQGQVVHPLEGVIAADKRVASTKAANAASQTDGGNAISGGACSKQTGDGELGLNIGLVTEVAERIVVELGPGKPSFVYHGHAQDPCVG